ncbi:MAG: peptidyl-prolyl cis-trans isomerase [Candidatus Dadabacteria bacterium]|nr:peptidyl-prolyl cis-trans isomerase [Candidatus Dadabacteria bacterium]
MKRLIVIAAIVVLSVMGCSREEKTEKAEAKKAPPPKHAAVKEKTSYEIPEEDKTLIARINGAPIYKEDLGGERLGKLINMEILYIEGLRRGIDKSPKVKDLPEDRKKMKIIDTLKSDLMRTMPKPRDVTKEEAMKYYNENEAKYTNVIAKQIIVSDKTLAEEIRKKADAGGDLDNIAAEYAKAGKELTVNPKKVRKKEESIFAKLEVGAVSPVREKGEQFEILQISELRKKPFKQAYKAITRNITGKKNRAAAKKMLDRFVEENNISIEIIEEE